MRMTTLDSAVDRDWENLAPDLRECGEIAGMRLSQVLADAVLNASNFLFTQAMQSLTPIERDGWVEAADMARSMRLGVGQAFLRQFQLRYAQACRQGMMVGTPSYSVFPGQEQYDAPKPAESNFLGLFRQYVAWDGLLGLNRCYAALLANPSLDPFESPVGPNILESAIVASLRFPVGHEVARQRVLDAVFRELLGKVNLLYRDLTSFMIALGFVKSGVVSRTDSSTAVVRAEDSPVTPSASDPLSEQKVEDVSEASADTEPEPSVECLLDSLKHGMWMEYHRSGKAPHPLKLSWVSPKRSLFLWTTAEGGRTLCVSADELSAAFASGQARLIDKAQMEAEGQQDASQRKIA